MLQDGLEPEVWRVRVCLVDPSFATVHDGDLRERVEAALTRGPPAAP